METNGSDFNEADAFAAHYDKSAATYGWYSPEVLFGLVYDRLAPGERLLDLGIGTGLSSVPFQKAGLQVHGVDGSRKMLEQCALRGVAIDLKQYDIRSAPLPFTDSHFDHVIACGVFHLVGHLEEIFAEAARLIRGTGTFGFTTEALQPDRLQDVRVDGGILEIRNEKSGVLSYLHSDNLIEDLVRRNGFETTKTLDFVAYRKTEWAGERTFRAYVCVKDPVQSPDRD